MVNLCQLVSLFIDYVVFMRLKLINLIYIALPELEVDVNI